MSELLLLHQVSIFQLYHDKNKVIFNDMMKRVVSKQEATEGWVFLFLLCVWSVYFPTNFDVFLYVPYTLSCMYYADTFCIKSATSNRIPQINSIVYCVPKIKVFISEKYVTTGINTRKQLCVQTNVDDVVSVS
jgi:hypothetical protein